VIGIGGMAHPQEKSDRQNGESARQRSTPISNFKNVHTEA
jgi:hypothetical protein